MDRSMRTTEAENLNSGRAVQWILPAAITLLALGDGALHFALDAVLFRGNFFGRLGPPPGGAPPANPPPGPPVPLPLPLNQMFLLNVIGYVVLIGLFWFAMRRRPTWLRWVDVVLIAYVAAAFLSWLDYGHPNPMGLGYLSKGIEIVLLLALLAHAWMFWRGAALRSEPGLTLQAHPRR